MKIYNNIFIYILILLIFFACKKDENNIITEYIPKYNETEKLGYKIKENTRYFKTAIFSSIPKQNPYKFIVKKRKSKNSQLSYLTKYPHALYINKKGNIYINNWIMKTENIKKIKNKLKYVPQLMKLDKQGNILKKVESNIEIDYITKVRNSNYIIVANRNKMFFFQDNLTKKSKIHDFSFDRVPMAKIFQTEKDRAKIYRISSYVCRIDLNKDLVDIKYRLRGTKEELKEDEKRTGNIFNKNYPKIKYFDKSTAYLRMIHANVFENVKYPGGDRTFYCVGIDHFGNEYYHFAIINKQGKLDTTLNYNPQPFLVVRSKNKQKIWKLDLPYLYGKTDINALGGRTYYVTPSGIVYILNVHPKHGIHLDKYVPAPVAKKVGGAAKAYY